MKVIAFLLIVNSLTKFYLTTQEIDTTSIDLLFNQEILKQISKAILTYDGLLGLLAGLFILCL